MGRALDDIHLFNWLFTHLVPHYLDRLPDTKLDETFELIPGVTEDV